ncbi:MAG: hypothetical protein D3924_07945 [Candidatus Electrothrix sp. AR4]|nr:hypothetical protein [Candidatus Electrothrix sp. AR4]
MRNKILLFMLALLFIVPGSAFSSSADARKAADFIARSSVKTIYKNLRAEGISWERIRDRHMPAILSRSLRSIRSNYSRRVILDDFLPTLINSYYSEIDRINGNHSVTCVESNFIVSTLVPFVEACEVQLGPWQISVEQVVDVLLDISYPYQVCSVSGGSNTQPCKNTVQNAFANTFNVDYGTSRFKKVCSDTSWF